MEVAPVLEISGAEEGSTELSVREHPLGDCLSDGGFPRSGESIEPVDRRFVEVTCPTFDLVQDVSTSPLETTTTVAVSVLGLLSVAGIVEDTRFGCRRNRVRALLSGTRKLKVL